jgi:diguanylate cyclase (GGDEF)-like protein
LVASEVVSLDDLPWPLLVIGSGLISHATPAAAHLLARPAAELVGLRLGDLVHPRDRDRLEAALASADGDEAIVHLGPRPVGIRTRASADGRVLVALRDLAGERPPSAVVDVGDDPDALESVAGTEGPLLSLAEAAPFGILLMNRVEQVVYLSQMGRGLLGFGETDDATGWRDRFVPGGRQAIDGLVAGGLVGAEAQTVTTAFELPDGRLGSMRVRVAPHLDARSQPLGAIVALEDVTAEVAARAESERLLQMLDATSDFVAIFRPSGEILHTNAALAQLLAENAAAGGTGRLGDLLQDREGFINRGLAVIATADTWHGELTLQIAPGRTLAVSALGVVGRDEQGQADWVAMVARDISDLKEAETRLRRLATSDHLTGLPNRALLTEQLDATVDEASRTGRSVAVLFCDLDRFKEVNDRYGHGAGDAVLVEIADRLCTIIRSDDLVARVGGDEFVVLCDGADDPEDLAALADRLIQEVHRPIAVGDSEVQVGISIGVALSRGGQGGGDRVLTAADQAMYRAKATGGNRYRIIELSATPGTDP